jgi:hypothetical protein
MAVEETVSASSFKTHEHEKHRLIESHRKFPWKRGTKSLENPASAISLRGFCLAFHRKGERAANGLDYTDPEVTLRQIREQELVAWQAAKPMVV